MQNIDGLFVSDSKVNLMPSERLDIKNAIAAESNSYQTKSSFDAADSANAIESSAKHFAERLISRINSLGYQCFVSSNIKDEDNWTMYSDGTMMWTPKVSLLGRYDAKKAKQETDYDKLQWQCQHGYVDGKVGKLKNGNTWTDDVDKTSVLF
jgi:hypothetical protein